MIGSEFAQAMIDRVAEFCHQYDSAFPAYSYIPLETDSQRLRVMQSRLFNEVRAAEVFGAWLRTTPEIEVKEALAEAAHEEMRHARLLAERIGERGVEPFDYLPVPGQIALFNAFELLPTTIERIAAFPLAGEGVAEYMIEHALTAPSVPEWIKAPYRAIAGDERDHADYPSQALARYARDPATQHRVRRAVAMSLTLRRQYFADLDDWVLRDRVW
jgi:1,2-phenylacetyl-CoA epoxidase catalytic subunit